MARSSEYGYMTDEELLEKLQNVAYTTIVGILDDRYTDMEDIDSVGKINMINGIVNFMDEIQIDMRTEAELHGSADN